VTWYCKSMPSTWACSPRRLAAPQHLSIAEPSRPEHAGRPHIPSRLLKPASAAQCLAQGPRRPHRRKGVPGRLPLGHTAPRSGIPCVARVAPHQGGVCALGPDGMGLTLCGAKKDKKRRAHSRLNSWPGRVPGAALPHLCPMQHPAANRAKAGPQRSADSYVGTMYLMLMNASGPPVRSSSASAAAMSSPRHVASRCA